QVQLMADPMASSLPHVKGGRLKALAVTAKTRSALAPDVPTVEESGMPAFEMLSWCALWAPKDLDPAARAYLEEKIAAVGQSQSFSDRLSVLGFEATYKTPAELEAYMQEEMATYAEIIEQANISID